MTVVIEVTNLGKQYILTHQPRERYTALREVLMQKARDWLCAPVSWLRKPSTESNNPSQELFWALRDVSFAIKEGESVGIIGRNGAGKSTLLKLVSRITEPTTGRITIKGRVASLLEVGTGFHPELTGRENIFLNGAILGMTNVEIKRKFDEIVDFAEVEKFLDTPVKHYSSGMHVRLAFAVAAHLEPEILLVDEVLAVGDAPFQKKCLGKMGKVASEGRTVLFVSHNMQAVQNLCNQAILLEQGKFILQGETSEVINRYLSTFSESNTFLQWDFDNAPGNENIKLLKLSATAINQDTNDCSIFTVDNDIELQFEFYNQMKGENNLDVTFHLQDEMGILVFVSSSGKYMSKTFKKGLIRAHCKIPKNLLNMGTFTISRLLFVKDKGYVVYEYPNALTFEIIMNSDGSFGWVGKKEGVICPQLCWDLQYMDRLERSMSPSSAYLR